MRVSVITTLFNYRDCIQDCMKSFLKQDFADAEMIIVDDASTDKPYDVIKKYTSDNLKYIRLDENKGYSNAKNVGIKAARADILVMLDADDMLTDHSIQMRFNKINEGFDFVHGRAWDLKSNGEMEKSKLWKKWKKCKKDASCYQYIHAQSVMLRKGIHRKIGLYDATLRSKSDREMWARALSHGFKLGFVTDFVVIYRKHGRQMHRSKEKLRINDQLQRHVLRLIQKRKKDLSGLEML